MFACARASAGAMGGGFAVHRESRAAYKGGGESVQDVVGQRFAAGGGDQRHDCRRRCLGA